MVHDLCFLAAALLLAVITRATAQPVVQPAISTALLSLPAAVTNWNIAMAGVPGRPWENGTYPCGSNGTGGQTVDGEKWQGLTCDSKANPMRLELGGLGLQGTLPRELASLQHLTALNLSSNAFSGSIPPEWVTQSAFRVLADADMRFNQLTGTLPSTLLLFASTRILLAGNRLSGTLPPEWSSAFLVELDLADNLITGLLPSQWGEKNTLSVLVMLRLQGNQLRGPIPNPQWMLDGLGTPANFYARPDNTMLCGPLMELDPVVSDTIYLEDPTLTVKKPEDGNPKLSTLVVWQGGMLDAEATVTITHTLGSCMQACSATGTKQGTAQVCSNFFDVTWAFNVSASDLLKLNPNGSTARPGDTLALPCYPPGSEGPMPFYFGGSMAYLKFSGGNQREGVEGLSGAMAASGTNDHLPNLNDFDRPYNGSLDPVSHNSSFPQMVQPVWLFVDLEAEFQVSVVVLTACAEMRNASIYIGSSSASVASNTLVAEALNFKAREQLAVPTGGAKGRYVIVYTGSPKEGVMSVSDFQVYAYETNAACNKPVRTSRRHLSADDEEHGVEALVDGIAGTCTAVLANNASNYTAWVAIDLGYNATVGTVTVLSAPSVPSGLVARAYVVDAQWESLPETTACHNDTMVLVPGAWAATPCNATGRIVVVNLPAVTSMVELCEVQVALTQGPIGPNPCGTNGGDGGSGSSLSDSAIMGIALGSMAVLALMVLAVWRHKRLALGCGKQYEHAWDSEGGVLQEQVAEGGTPSVAPDSDAAFGGVAAVGIAAGAAGLANGSSALAGSATPSVDSYPALPPHGGAVASNSSSARLYATPESHSSLGTSACTGSTGAGAGRSSSDTLPKAAVTDLSKLPPGFNDISADNFQLQRIIGSGSFGEVWLAQYCETNVAVKMLTNHTTPNAASTLQQQAALRNLHQEAGLMSRLRHPNVCQYLGACADPPCLLMEYCPRRSIDLLLSASFSDPKLAKQMSWCRLLSMALDAARGVLYLHTRSVPIVHRDLKSANLLVDQQWHVKVADFNLSRALESNVNASTLFVTNPRWLAPEVLSGHPGHLAADVWAFGSVLWELATWKLPFESMNPFQIITYVQTSSEGSGLEVPDLDQLAAGPLSCYKEYVALMQACWMRDPAKRPRFDEIVKQLRTMLGRELKQRQSAGLDRAGSAAVGPPHMDSSSPGPQEGLGTIDTAPAAAAGAAGRDGSEASGMEERRLAPSSLPPIMTTQALSHGSIPQQPSCSLDDTPFAPLSHGRLISPPDTAEGSSPTNGSHADDHVAHTISSPAQAIS